MNVSEIKIRDFWRKFASLAPRLDLDATTPDLIAEVDTLVDSIYSRRGYETDEQRLSDLFALYEELTAAKGKKT